MSLAEIKDEIAKLSPAEVSELKRYLNRDRLDDAEYLVEMDRRHDEMQRGLNTVTKEEMYARLRAAGRDV